MNWSEAVQKWIMDPEAQMAHPEVGWAFVVVHFNWNPEVSSHQHWMIHKHMQQVSILRHIKDICEPVHLQETLHTFSIFVQNAQDAIDVALVVVQHLAQKVKVTTGMGNGHLFEQFVCSEYLTCHHLFPFVQPYEVIVLEQLFSNIELPLGVGAFPASNVLQQRSGSAFRIIKDYR